VRHANTSLYRPFTVRSGTTRLERHTMAKFVSARFGSWRIPCDKPMNPPDRATNHHACSREIVAWLTL
jgi:hypothetical protein